MPRNKGNRLTARGKNRNADGQFSSNKGVTPVITIDEKDQENEEGVEDDDVEECSMHDDIDNRERGWYSEQDDNDSASADDSVDEFDEESISSDDHDFLRDEDFQMAISAIDSMSDEDPSDLEESSTLRSMDPANFLSWTKGADKGLIGNKMPRGSSRTTKWRRQSKAKVEEQRIKRVCTASSQKVAEAVFDKDGASSHKTRCIRVWGEGYLHSHKFAPCKQGKHGKFPPSLQMSKFNISFWHIYDRWTQKRSVLQHLGMI